MRLIMSGARGVPGTLFVSLLLLVATTAVVWATENPRVLVVMSYHSGNVWQDQQREGIGAGLKGLEIRYFDLDTKRNAEGGESRAAEAFRLYQEFKPDVVIASDDNAQSLFVLPYLKGKVETPVIFCGVNNDAAKYGYSANNVTGVLEIKHVKETISLAQLILGDFRKLVVIYKENTSNILNLQQIKLEEKMYPVDNIEVISLKTMEEAVAKLQSLEKEVGAVLVLNLTGITDRNGENIENHEAVKILVRDTKVPLISTEDYVVEAGALCGVVKSGFEQGAIAARMVRDVLSGKEVNRIGVDRNRNGQRYINLATAKQLGITLCKEAILGSRLIK